MTQKHIEAYLKESEMVVFKSLFYLNGSQSKLITVGIEPNNFKIVLKLKSSNQSGCIKFTKKLWKEFILHENQIMNYLNDGVPIEKIQIGDIIISSYLFHNNKIIMVSNALVDLHLGDTSVRQMFNIKKLIDCEFNILDALNISSYMEKVRNLYYNDTSVQSDYGNWRPFISSLLTAENDLLHKKFLMDLSINFPNILEKHLQNNIPFKPSLNYYTEY